jgi:hypothetical protein
MCRWKYRRTDKIMAAAQTSFPSVDGIRMRAVHFPAIAVGAVQITVEIIDHATPD